MKYDENLDFLTLFERYYLGDMAPEERTGFEARLQSDPDFAAAYASELLVFKSIEMAGQADFLAKMKTIHQEQVPVKKTARIRRLPSAISWAMAAVIAALLAFGLWWSLSPPSPEALYAQFYSIPEFDTNRSGFVPSGQLDQAAGFYKVKDFQAAANVLSDYLTSNEGTAKDSLYLSICWLETGKAAQARDLLQTLSSNASLADQAAWYLALSYLKEGNTAQSSYWLKQISEGTLPATPILKAKASEILKKLG
ncbi:MAG: hypothetical protein R2830_15065 [Saprospiraceae bacterium]